jgi:hypothetical protein
MRAFGETCLAWLRIKFVIHNVKLCLCFWEDLESYGTYLLHSFFSDVNKKVCHSLCWNDKWTFLDNILTSNIDCTPLAESGDFVIFFMCMTFCCGGVLGHFCDVVLLLEQMVLLLLLVVVLVPLWSSIILLAGIACLLFLLVPPPVVLLFLLLLQWSDDAIWWLIYYSSTTIAFIIYENK